MLCADALVTSRSTLGGLTMYHTRARTVYLPSTCDEEEGDFGLTPKRLVDARAEREDFEVYRRISLLPHRETSKPFTVIETNLSLHIGLLSCSIPVIRYVIYMCTLSRFQNMMFQASLAAFVYIILVKYLQRAILKKLRRYFLHTESCTKRQKSRRGWVGNP